MTAIINCYFSQLLDYKRAINNCRIKNSTYARSTDMLNKRIPGSAMVHCNTIKVWMTGTEKKSLFKGDFENQHYGGPTFTDPFHCWALFISPASGHLSFISHHDPCLVKAAVHSVWGQPHWSRLLFHLFCGWGKHMRQNSSLQNHDKYSTLITYYSILMHASHHS